jgi:DUF971 family protein
MKYVRLLGVSGGFVAFAGLACAQSAISARAGMVNYVEGQVRLDSKAVETKFGVFPQMKNGSELRTEDGRAEVLLSPGSFLRVAENSGVKMVSDRLTDTRLEFLSGSAVVECAELGKDDALTVTYKDATIALLRNGLYRVDSDPPELKVYDGEASVTRDGKTVNVKHSHLLPLEGEAVARKFDDQAGDSLTSWARRRSQYVAVANVSAAREAGQYGSWGSNSWAWNPYYGMYTYVPMSGTYSNYWGYRFWSPADAYYIYWPSQSGYGGSGSSGSSSSSLSTGNVQSATSGAIGRAMGGGSMGATSGGGSAHISGGGSGGGTSRKP